MNQLGAADLLRGLAIGILVIGWALLAHQGSAGDGTSDLAVIQACSPFLAFAVLLLWQPGKRRWIIPVSAAMLALLAWNWLFLRQNVAFLYFIEHAGTNLALATLFGRTLAAGCQPLVTRFALLAHNGTISPAKERYTRQLTLAWTLFFLLNALISSLLFWLTPTAVWSAYGNLAGPFLLGAMFVGEHLIRNLVLPPEDRTSIADTLRGFRRSKHAGAQGQ